MDEYIRRKVGLEKVSESQGRQRSAQVRLTKGLRSVQAKVPTALSAEDETEQGGSGNAGAPGRAKTDMPHRSAD